MLAIRRQDIFCAESDVLVRPDAHPDQTGGRHSPRVGQHTQQETKKTMSLIERDYMKRDRPHTQKHHQKYRSHRRTNDDYEFVGAAIKVTAALCLGIAGVGLLLADQTGDMPAPTPMQNPTYAEMQAFIASDTTDLRTYLPGTFMCHHYSTTVVRNANAQNMRAGYVLMTMDDGSNTWLGHAIVVFQTSDKGFYFLEPQLDVTFSMAEMETMIAKGRYSIVGASGYYFDNTFIGYSIDW